jgi:site-specific DNA recombinase
MTILDVVRNPTYIGKLPFRGTVHDAAHEPIVDGELFDRAQALLKERGQELSLRSANGTGYLLTSLRRCGRCCQGFVGTASRPRRDVPPLPLRGRP